WRLISILRGGSGSIAVAFTWWQTFEAAENSARSGTRPAISPKNKTGSMITQHPDLMRAVVSSVGIYDMLRVELAPNGAFNVTEFGTVRDPEQFKALYAYSPYHHVVDG